jgi:hypothetical protein
MRVGQIITFKLPSSQKKIAGKILEVREKNLLVQTKDSKKVIPKSLLNKKITKEEFEKARLELQKILKKKSTKSSIEKKPKFEKKVETKPQAKKPMSEAPETQKKVKQSEAKKTYLIDIHMNYRPMGSTRKRKMTLPIFKKFIEKTFKKKLTSGQEKKIDYMADVTLKGKKDGFFIIDPLGFIFTNHNVISDSTGEYVGKVDMGEKIKLTLTEEQKKDRKAKKEEQDKADVERAKKHDEQFGKMEDLKDLWKKLKDLKWSSSDRREIEDYIKDVNTFGPAYNSLYESPHDVKAEVIQKGKRPVKNVLRIYYSKLNYSTGNRPGKFKKEDFEFPEEEKKEEKKEAPKKRGVVYKKSGSNTTFRSNTDKQLAFLKELRKKGLSEAELTKEFRKKFG